MKKSLAIIPARSGSQRVPNKNIRLLNGIPLIAYTIKAAQESELLDRVVVSTDSKKIANIASEFGADVPFIRPKELAQDDTPDQPVFLHAIQELEKAENYKPDFVLNLRPTSPFKTAEIIDSIIQELNVSSVDMVRTISESNGIYHPYWMFELNQKGIAKQFMKRINLNDYSRSQLLPKVYRINGVVDGMRREVIEMDKMLSTSFKGLPINELSAMDIDTEFDFKICELMAQSK